ncbi:MAG: hypothetical protein HN578_13605 [Rhodospirillales bacterium]|nr:hypothetical protein [Rhodospirillales bacterium]
MSIDTEILIFVEDPGAANCVTRLPSALEDLSIGTSLFAAGTAVGYLGQQGIAFTELPEGSTAASLLDNASPKLVLVGTSEDPDTFGLQLVAPAQERGIPTVGIVDGPANPQHRFRGRGDAPLHHVPDFLIVPTDPLKKTFVQLGHGQENIFIGGHPHYDAIKEKRGALREIGRAALRKKILPEISDERPLIVFAAEISDGLDPTQFQRSADYTLRGRGQSDLRTNIVLEELLDSLNTLGPKPYMVLRLHPKNTRQEYSVYASEIDHISDSGSPLDVCFAADLVVGMTSILLIEAAILGRPTLSIIPRDVEKNWLDSIELGLTKVATSRDELHQAISQFMKDWPKETDNRVDEVINFGSTDRIAKFLTDKIADESL